MAIKALSARGVPERRRGRRVASSMMAGAAAFLIVVGGYSVFDGPAVAQEQDPSRVAAGFENWKLAACSGCHGTYGQGGGGSMNPEGPNLRETDLDRDQIVQRVASGRRQMPAFGNILGPEDIEVLVDYLMARVVGAGDITFEDCVFNQGGDDAGCNAYR